jgi:hypothetical protein
MNLHFIFPPPRGTPAGRARTDEGGALPITAELKQELRRAGFEKDPPGPLTESNRPAAGRPLTRGGPVIYEGTFRTVRRP